MMMMMTMNLRNLGRIASKLTKPPKVQLVHFLILSNIDYWNALFSNTPEHLLRKLTKVICCKEIYFLTSWFCFAYAFATIFENLSFFTS